MARPEKLNAEKLKKTVAFRLTDANFDLYEKKFSASGLSQSEFFRQHVLTNTTTVLARPVASQDAKRAVFLLQKASNNINQLAHRANAEHLAKKISEATFVAILCHLHKLNQFLLEQTGEAKK